MYQTLPIFVKLSLFSTEYSRRWIKIKGLSEVTEWLSDAYERLLEASKGLSETSKGLSEAFRLVVVVGRGGVRRLQIDARTDI